MRKLLSTFLLMLGFIISALAQNRTVSGTVTDSKGTPIQGASVLVAGTKLGTSTDEQGKFSLSVPQSANALIVSAVNNQTQRVSIKGNTVNVRLTANEGNLEEVVVTGIRTVKKVEYAGAASRVSRGQIDNKPLGSLDQGLQGLAPGLSVLTSSGQPGTSANIIIRGQQSIQGGSNPLFIMDGIPIEAGVFQGINSNDIESIDVLKDAASTAPYGSRGSAGVVVITTRRGTGGKMKLSYSTQYGIKAKPDFAFSPMTTAQLLQAQNDYGRILSASNASGYAGTISIPGWYYAKNNPRYATLSAAQQATNDRMLDSISKINTNWMDYMFRTGTFQNHDLNLQGGTGKTRIYSNLGYYKELGVTPRTDMKRISWRNNVDYADDHFSIGFSSSIAYTKRNFQQSTTTNSTANPFLAVNIATPYARVYDDNGKYFVGNNVYYPLVPSTAFVGANQLDVTSLDQNYNDQVKGLLSTNMSYKIGKYITAAVVAGLDFRETQNTQYGSKLAFNRYSSGTLTTKAGFQYEDLARYFSYDIRPSLDFRRNFTDKHLVDVMLVGELVKEYTKSFSLTGYGIDPRTPNTPAAITQGNAANQLYAAVGGGKGRNSLFSGLLLVNYVYNDKYSISASYRQDGSSKLPTATRWQDFYSVGLGWTITQENFMKGISFINNLKLRLSYGGAGNSNNFPFGNFGYLDTYAANGNYSGLTTQYVSNVGNPNLKWEKTYTKNLGLDFALYKNKISGSLEVYDRLTKDLFVLKQLPAEAGGYAVNINAGELSNKGVEADVKIDVISTKKVIWTIRGNVGYNKNKIKSLAGEQPYTVGTSRITEGLPLGSHYEVAWAGVDQATGAPLYYKKDGTITSVYSADDKVQRFGTWEAPWKGGFGTGIRFSGFDLSTSFSWQKGATKMDNLEYFVENPVGFLSGGYNQSASLNFWKKPGDVASTPSPLYGTNFSSKLIHDASFLRLRDVTLAYSVSSDKLSKLKFVSRLKFYVQGTNLFMWTHWRGMDPEAGPSNINLSEFPNPRAITCGLDLTF